MHVGVFPLIAGAKESCITLQGLKNRGHLFVSDSDLKVGSNAVYFLSYDDDGFPVGVLKVRVDEGAEWADIVYVSVVPDWRGRGVAKSLYLLLAQYCINNDLILCRGEPFSCDNIDKYHKWEPWLMDNEPRLALVPHRVAHHIGRILSLGSVSQSQAPRIDSASSAINRLREVSHEGSDMEIQKILMMLELGL